MNDVFSSPSRKDGHGKSKKDAFDFFHINSVDKIDSGDYIISARYMHAVVCISGKTGEILWQLGGKNNNFEDLNRATDFAWQHHVTWQGNDTISLFDNHANNVFHKSSSHSKGMIISLDMKKMTASLVGKYVHPDEILNVSQGSVQVLPESGNVLVGFGNSPTYVEYTDSGKVLCAAHFAPHIAFELIDFGLVKSYRVFKSPWVGSPKTVPTVKVKNGKAYVSWNGATKVKRWRLETAKTKEDDEFVTLQELNRDGFETAFPLHSTDRYVRIAALGSKGVMAYSAAVKSHPRPSVSLASQHLPLPTLTAQVSLWSILVMFGFAVTVFYVAGFFYLYQRLPRLPHLSKVHLSKGQLRRFPQLLRLSWLPHLRKLSGFQWRSYTAMPGNEENDAELDPLMLNDRQC